MYLDDTTKQYFAKQDKQFWSLVDKDFLSGSKINIYFPSFCMFSFLFFNKQKYKLK